ncbi:MAG: PQQ-dependent sugar dehydrogenase [Thermomicrobiales bacterium]|nr:PQQ-dependent sugar dehydrogenase [Thermomicrobiales bacterium]
MITVFHPGTRARLLAVMVALASIVAGLIAPAGGLLRAQEGAFDPNAFAVGFERVADGFARPVQIVDPNDGSGRLFVVEQVGTIRILIDGDIQDEPFLDIVYEISSGNEQGLLSMALHPNFAENGTFFIDYTDVDGNTQIERWQVSADNPNQADPESAVTVLSVAQPYPNHNGGLLLFGPDGYLYVGLGDGGSQGDPEGNGQDLGALLGKILRIDVDNPAEGQEYGIPDDNPFVGDEGAAGEVWAYGLRNPWRFSFDRETGDLYIADVGQNVYEEVSVLPAGGDERNFGWNLMEGPACYAVENCDPAGLVAPFFSYTHDEGGCSVTGGYVYRGESIRALQGVYLTADYCTGLLWGVGKNAAGEWVASAPIETGLSVSSFGEDADGELYVIDLSGGIYRVTAAA